ncbi:MAG: DUF4331 domain-containing protein [Rubrivivax sp.]|nr:MAG: DUF4331 domain-containing protein [Rubrivivax sp.]
MHPFQPKLVAAATLALCTCAALASSHREAPFIATSPKVDATDFYLFNSYEGVASNGTGGRAGFVTLIANYQPLQDAYGGPNYFSMDPDALYEIHIDNTGDAVEDITFQFRFKNTLKPGASPLIQGGPVSGTSGSNLNLTESYTVDIVRGARRSTNRQSLTAAGGANATFTKPVDYIGAKTLGAPSAYEAYASQYIYNVTIPGCSTPGKVFVGQRKDPFAVNLGTIFDLVNVQVAQITNPALINAFPNTIDDKNVTTLALEVAASCLTGTGNGVIGGWTTASLRQARLLSANPKRGHLSTPVNGGAWVQVSRLGMPLVNEVVIGLRDKDKFNASQPKNDTQFGAYVTAPALPGLIDAVLNLGGAAPTVANRTDLQATFLTGIHGLNQLATVTPSEMLRLNTGVPPVPAGSQNRLGVVGSLLASSNPGSDLAGYPNGRRPKDDVVDISLVAVMGGLCSPAFVAVNPSDTFGLGATCDGSTPHVPLGNTSLSLHDGVDQAQVPLRATFPYLSTPIGGTATAVAP